MRSPFPPPLDSVAARACFDAQVVPTQQQHLSVQKPQRIQGVDAARGSVASRPAAPKPALGEDGDIVPDMTAYVKRMSIIDENGCSSGQVKVGGF